MSEEVMELNLRINRSDLVGECERIPNEVDYWGRVKAEASYEMDRLHRVYRVTKAEVSLEMKGKTIDGKPPTDKVVEALVDADSRTTAAWMQYLDAKKEFDYADTAYFAMINKSKKIEDMKVLLVKGFYAGISSKKDDDNTFEVEE